MYLYSLSLPMNNASSAFMANSPTRKIYFRISSKYVKTSASLSCVPFILLRRFPRSEEHTSELQSLAYLVCRLLLEKKKYYTRLTLLLDFMLFLSSYIIILTPSTFQQSILLFDALYIQCIRCRSSLLRVTTLYSSSS